MVAPTSVESLRNRCEDALFMLDHGEHFDRAAARLGIAPATLEKSLERWKKLAKQHPDSLPRTGEDQGDGPVLPLRRTG